MARGVNLEFIADVAPLLRGTADVEKALDDVVDSLGDVATEASTTSDKTTGELDAIGDQAKTSADDLERSFRESFNTVKRTSSTTSDDIARNVKRGTDDGISSTAEFKKEGLANLTETASSFQGDWSTAIDTVQGTLGGLTAALPIAGGAIAATAALGIGAVRNMYNKAAERRKAFKEATESAVSDLYDNLLENQGKLDRSFQESKIKEWIGSLSSEEVDKFSDAAATLGLTLGDLAKAQAGDEGAIRKLETALKSGKASQDAWNAAALEATDANGAYTERAFDATDQANKFGDAIDTINGKLGDQGLALQTAKDKATAATDAIDTLGQTESALPTTIEQDVKVDTTKADGHLKTWQQQPRFLDVKINPVVDEWLLQRTINKVKSQSERLLGP